MSSYAELTSWEGRAPTLWDTVPVWMALAPIRLAKGVYWHARFQLLFRWLGRAYGEGSEEADYATWLALQDEPHMRLSFPKWANIEADKRDDLVRRQLWLPENMKAWKRETAIAKKKTW